MLTEKAMRRALFGVRAKRAERCPSVRRVVLNCRPADGKGEDIYLHVPVNTISKFEADLLGLAEARRQGLRSSVVIRYEYHD